jgi:hypothetical protein
VFPGHVLFADTLAYCMDGRTNRTLKSTLAENHAFELFMLLHHDVDGDLWVKTAANAEGRKIRKALDGLADRVARDSDECAAKLLYSIAADAAYEVMNIYVRHRELFDRIAPRRKLLPCLQSIHPRTAGVSSQMRGDARLGEQTDDKFRIGSKGWFVSDAPANVYARAIILHVEFNQLLQPVEVQQGYWKSFDRQHRIRTRVLPFPKYVEGIDQIPTPIAPECVRDYWRKGKEIILDEMPDFHQRPEWKGCRERAYAHGAKRGAIQHAIFKDILMALRTIAGANKRANRKK